MRLNRLACIEVGGLEKQIRKPFRWENDGDFIEDVIDAVERSCGNIGRDTFVGVGADSLTFGSGYEDVNIQGIGNDWDEKRFRFVMDVELTAMSKYSKVGTRAIVQGYTEHADATHRGRLDPKMRMYINNICTVQDIQDGARGTTTRVIDISQTLLGDIQAGNVEILIRPSDIFSTIDCIEDSLDEDMSEMVDTRSTFHRGVQLSKRSTSMASNYLKDLVEADLSASDNLVSHDPNLINDTRDSLAREVAGGSIQSYRSNAFLKALQSNNRNFKGNNWFTIRDVADLLDVTVNHIDDMIDVYQPDIDLESDVWTGGSAEVKASFEICHSIPIIMADCYIDSIELTSDNLDSRNGEPCTGIQDLTSMLGENVRDRRHINKFIDRFNREVFRRISNNGQQLVDLEISSEICGLTTIKISIDDEHSYRYVFASFADGMLSPNVTNDSEVSLDLANGYIDLRREIDEVVQRTQPEISLSTDVRGAKRNRDRGSRGRVDRPRNNLSLLDDDLLGGKFELKGMDEL